MTAVSYGSRGPTRISAFFRRIGPTQAAALLIGVLAGVLLAASEFTTLRSVVVLGASCEKAADPGLARDCVATGGDQHAYALVLLGAALCVLAVLATLKPRTARAAALGMVAIGFCVIATALFRDVPTVSQTGVVGASFTAARAMAGPALWLEFGGAALAALGGLLTLVASRARPPASPG